LLPLDLAEAWADLLETSLGVCLPPDRRRRFEAWVVQTAAGRGIHAADWCAELGLLPLHDPVWQDVIEMATVGETYFWRNERHMAMLTDIVLPNLVSTSLTSDRQLTIWSAGCSSGEELYTIAMILDQLLPGSVGERFRLIGIDINGHVLENARAGLYSPHSLRSLSPEGWQWQYLTPVGNKRHAIAPAFKENVIFEQLELTEAWPPHLLVDEVDLIVCRNVMIYLIAERRRRVLDVFRQRLHPDGWVLFGDAEVDDLVYQQFQLHSHSTLSLFCAKLPADSEAPPAGRRGSRPSTAPAEPAAAAPWRQGAPEPLPPGQPFTNPQAPAGVRTASPPAVATPAAPVTSLLLLRQTITRVARGETAQARAALITAAGRDAESVDLHMALTYLALVGHNLERAIEAIENALGTGQAEPAMILFVRQLRRCAAQPDWSRLLLDFVTFLGVDDQHE
jgi:chemotaxis protein methyltransferase CheR